MMIEAGAIHNGHFVLANGAHSGIYFDKSKLLSSSAVCATIAEQIARVYERKNIQAVVGPAVGAVGLVALTAHMMMAHGFGAGQEMVWAYAEPSVDRHVNPNKPARFYFRRDFARVIDGKRVLVVEDVLTTGSSARMVVEAARKVGGDVVGLTAIINRGGVNSAVLGSPGYFKPLWTVKSGDFSESECPLCESGVLINEDFGHGSEFLASRGAR